MITTNLYLDIRHHTKLAPVKIRVTVNREHCFLPTGVSIPATAWDKSNQKVVRLPEADFHNATLQYKLSQARMKIMVEENEGTYANKTIKEIRNILQVQMGIKREEEVVAYFAHWCRKVAAAKSPSTGGLYLRTLIRIEKFCNATNRNLETLRFTDITPRWLRDFDDFQKATLAANTRNIDFRNIRAVFNRALDDEAISCYPFRKFKHKTEETRKRALSIEELRTLWNYPCDPHLTQYIDLFKLVFYLRGINLADLFYLTPNDYAGGRIIYRRAKTHKLYSVKVEPEAEAIINKYRGKKYLLSWGDRYKEHTSLTHRTNKMLKTIGEVERKGRGGKKHYTPLFPHISIYAARHSVATLMAELDIPNETIAETLGHSYGNSTTAIYIKPNQSKVDKAMRRIIDYVLG